MANLGNFSLILALLVSLYGAGATFFAGRKPKELSRLSKSGQRSLIASFGLISLAVFCLLGLLATRDLRVEYVASHVSRDLPLLYTLTAFWAGQAGSLLLWSWMVALTGLIGLLTLQRFFGLSIQVRLYTYHGILSVLSFFLALIVFVTSPFGLLPFTPAEGLGLNPQLQHPIMAIHPPTLYAGYIAATLPFALVLGMLLAKSDETGCLRAIRTFSLVSWGLLSVGNILGANWAYETLGWGGFWAWDPVENAGILPWFTLTAVLHTMLLQDRMGILKKWNLSLVVLSFGLTIFGTFLTRSGIISSVHAFVQNKTFTISFTVFLVGVLLYGFGLIALNRRRLSSEKSIESIPLLSRPSALLLTCLILIAITFSTLWGTLFPLVSEAIMGQKLSLDASFFNTINAPLAWGLLFILGAGFLVPPTGTPLKKGLPRFLGAILFGLALFGALRIALGIKTIEFFLSVSLLGFATAALMVYALSSSFRSTLSLRRLGALFIHFGLLLALLGIFGQYGHSKQEVSLQKGESVAIGQGLLRFEGLAFKQNGPWITVSSLLHLYKDGKFQASLIPSKTFLRNQEQPVTKVAVQSSAKEDFYAVLAGYDFAKQQGVFEIHHNPLIVFLWIGGGVMGLGCLMALFPGFAVNLPESSGLEKPAPLGKA